MPVCWSAQEWLSPVVMAVASVMPSTCMGIEELALVPLPSWPNQFVPQQDMVPSSWSAQEYLSPVVMVFASAMPAT